MIATEDIRDIFSILHDGTIIRWSGDKKLLSLTVDCQYLAKRLNPAFDSFYIYLVDVDKIELLTWPNPFNLPVQTLTKLEEIFKAELKILSAEIKSDVVVIACNQHDTTFDYCGGNLSVSCQEIKIHDQNKREMAIDELDKICKEYWQEWSTK